MSRPVRVSVVMPARNARATIGASIHAVLAQSVASLELLVVDDASTDGTMELVTEASRSDPRVVPILCDAQRGVSGARNLGLEAASGEFVQFMDADDSIAPDALERLVGHASQHGTDGAACGFRVIGRCGGPIHEHEQRLESIGPDSLLARAVLITHCHVVRREAIGSLRFDTGLDAYEDLDMWIRLAESGVRWSCAPGTLADYVWHPGGLSKRCVRMGDGGCRVLSERFAGDPGLDRALAGLALQYATRACMTADSPKAEIDALLDRWSASEIEPARAASAARMGFVFGLGVRSDEDTLERRLGPWWRALEASGRARAGFEIAARGCLSDQLGLTHATAGAA